MGRSLAKFGAAMTVLTCATPLLAQEVDKAPPGEPLWRTIVVAVILVIAIAVGSFVGARRPHNEE